MRLDCLDGESQRFRRFARGEPTSDEAEHLQLAVAEALDGIAPQGSAGGPFRTRTSQVRGQGLAQIDVSTEHLPQSNQQLIRGRVLHDVAAGTGRQQPLGVDQFIVHRENQHRQIWTLGVHIAHQLEPVPLRQRNIDDDHVRRERADRGARFAFSLHFATNRQVGLRLDHAPQALADDRVVVHDENTPLHSGGGRRSSRDPHSTLARSSGKEQWIEAPPRTPVSMMRSPPNIWVRYSMIFRPRPP